VRVIFPKIFANSWKSVILSTDGVSSMAVFDRSTQLVSPLFLHKVFQNSSEVTFSQSLVNRQEMQHFKDVQTNILQVSPGGS